VVIFLGKKETRLRSIGNFFIYIVTIFNCPNQVDIIDRKIACVRFIFFNPLTAARRNIGIGHVLALSFVSRSLSIYWLYAINLMRIF